jgi:hypothetical protein
MQRSTIIVLVLLVLLGGAYWYTQQEDNALSAALAGGTPTPAPALPGYLLEPYSKFATSLSIRKADGTQVSLEFKDNLWEVRSGTTLLEPVDQQAAESAAFAVQDLRILSEVEGWSSLADFGLDEENASIMEAGFSDGTSLTVWIGNPTVTGSGYYVRDMNQPGKILVVNKLSLDGILSLPENPPVLPTDSLESTPTPEQ